MTTAEQLDPPYPGDESESEYQARRRKLLEDLSDEAIQDIVSDVIMDPGVVAIVRRHIVLKDERRVPEHLGVGFIFSERIAAEIERYLEAHE